MVAILMIMAVSLVKMRVELHADPATGAFGVPLYGATNPVRGAPR